MINEVDKKILNIIQKDARVTNAEIARQIGLAPSAVLERVKKLEERGVIRGYATEIDAGQIGFGLTAFVAVVASAARDEATPWRWVVAGAYLLFALLGNVLGKVQRNFWVGVRTPWTLASDTVWTQTHRLAAWLFVAGGLVGFAATLAGASGVWLFVGVLVAIAGVPVVYSLVLYKRLERQGRVSAFAGSNLAGHVHVAQRSVQRGLV